MNIEVMTARGTPIRRYGPTGVGKFMGSKLYLHGFYLWEVGNDVFPRTILERATRMFRQQWRGWNCRCVRLDLKTCEVRFDHAPLFDSEREPRVGHCFNVHPRGELVVRRHSNSIWHHKWLWVKDDYQGFDVAQSHAWSAKYAPLLKGPPSGSAEVFARQLAEAGLA